MAAFPRARVSRREGAGGRRGPRAGGGGARWRGSGLGGPGTGATPGRLSGGGGGATGLWVMGLGVRGQGERAGPVVRGGGGRRPPRPRRFTTRPGSARGTLPGCFDPPAGRLNEAGPVVVGQPERAGQQAHGRA